MGAPASPELGVALPPGYRVTCSAAEVAARVARYAAAPLRVLSLWQPWATLCVAHDPAYPGQGRGAKGVETRGWRPQGAGPIPVVVHACKRWDRDMADGLRLWPFDVCLTRCGVYPRDPVPYAKRGLAPVWMNAPHRLIPLGEIVGVAVVERWDPAASLMHSWFPAGEDTDPRRLEEARLGNYGEGRWGWRLADVLELPRPIPFQGTQRALYLLGDAVRAEVLDQLQALAARVAAEEDAG